MSQSASETCEDCVLCATAAVRIGGPVVSQRPVTSETLCSAWRYMVQESVVTNGRRAVYLYPSQSLVLVTQVLC